MEGHEQRLLNARNWALAFWLGIPVISFAGCAVMKIGGGISTTGAVWSISVAIVYLALNGIFYWRVWKNPSENRSKKSAWRIFTFLALFVCAFLVAQFISQDVGTQFRVDDTWIPLWVSGTVRGWGFPSFWMRELSETFGLVEEYGRIVIDYESLLSNLLFALFFLFVFHWWLGIKWHGRLTSSSEGGQQDEDRKPDPAAS